jgi:hypothetical protein
MIYLNIFLVFIFQKFRFLKFIFYLLSKTSLGVEKFDTLTVGYMLDISFERNSLLDHRKHKVQKYAKGS